MMVFLSVCLKHKSIAMNGWILIGICGNNKVEGFEECDGGKCCDGQCKLVPMCCAGDGEQYECVQIASLVDGLTDTRYDGYYGACVSDREAAVYVKDNGLSKKMYLRQTESLTIWDDGTKCSSRWSVGGHFFSGFDQNKGWIASDSLTDTYSNVFCGANGNDIQSCEQWKQVVCDDEGSIDWTAKDLKEVRVRQVGDASKCVDKFDHSLCLQKLNWVDVPRMVVIEGASYSYLNGKYINKDDSCYQWFT
eukprot:17262_1